MGLPQPFLKHELLVDLIHGQSVMYHEFKGGLKSILMNLRYLV